MKQSLYISSYCTIEKGIVNLNGKEIFRSNNPLEFEIFAKEIYKTFEFSYPKYFKMDNLSKLGYVCSELLIRETKITERYVKENISILFQNSASSLNTDIEYQKTYINKSEYFPSPALFVYTLPNIVIGEICIAHKITGENALFVSETFNHEALYSQVLNIFSTTKTEVIICGWIDFNPFEFKKYSAKLFIIEKQNEGYSKEFNLANFKSV